MKKILIAAFAAIVSLSAFAQKDDDNKREHGKFHKEGHLKEMSEHLNLTEGQQKQVKELNEDFRKQMQALNSNTSLSAEEKKAKRMEIMKAHKDKMQSILTTEQQEKAKEMKEERKDHGERGHEGKWNNLTKDLNLSAEQTTKVNALNETLKTNMQNLKSNTTLSQEQRKEEMKNLVKKHRDDVMALLTEEQKKQLKEKRKEMKN